MLDLRSLRRYVELSACVRRSSTDGCDCNESNRKRNDHNPARSAAVGFRNLAASHLRSSLHRFSAVTARLCRGLNFRLAMRTVFQSKRRGDHCELPAKKGSLLMLLSRVFGLSGADLHRRPWTCDRLSHAFLSLAELGQR